MVHSNIFYVTQGIGEEAISTQMSHPNVFALSHDSDDALLLGDIQSGFPFLPRNPNCTLSFSFRSTVNKTTQWIYVDQTDTHMSVPTSVPGGSQYFLKVHVPSNSGGLVALHPFVDYSKNNHQQHNQQPQSPPTQQQRADLFVDEASFAHGNGSSDDTFDTDYGNNDNVDDEEEEEDLDAFAMRAALEESCQEQEKHEKREKRDKRERKKKKTERRRRRSESEQQAAEVAAMAQKKHEDAALQRANEEVQRRTSKTSRRMPRRNSNHQREDEQWDDKIPGEEQTQHSRKKSGLFGMLKSGLKSGLKSAASAATGAASVVRSVVRRQVTLEFDSITVLLDAEPFAEGGFCTVYHATDANDSLCEYALKWMVVQDQSQLKDAMWEIDVHRRLVGHPHIMELCDHMVRPSEKIDSRTAKDVLLLYPLSRGGSLFDQMEIGSAQSASWPFPEKVALRYFVDACEGIRHMHKKGMAHRDIKPHNILLFDNGDGTHRAVVMDLGSTSQLEVKIRNRREANELQDECQSKCSPPYRAPELHDPSTDVVIDGRVDVFSLGATLYALAYGFNPFENPKRGFEKLALLNGNAHFPENGENMYGMTYSKAFNHLIKAMLKPNPSKRTKLSKVMKAAKGLLDEM
jgi:serine/threonine kinase 16